MDGISVELVSKVATFLMTLIFGFLSKKFKWIESKYIPYQNLAIGILAGLLCYATGLETNLLISIISCIASTMLAGGTYDVIHVTAK